MSTDTVIVTVSEPDDQAPGVVSGLIGQALSDQQIELTWQPSTDNVALAGYRVYRDGIEIGVAIETTYTDSGLSAQMSYSYYVVAFDGAGNESAPSETVSVTTEQVSLEIEVRVASGSDDAEEGENGSIQLSSSDLELVDDVGAGNQLVGLRFAGLQIPQGVQVNRAWIEFETDEVGSDETSLTITMEASDDAIAFDASAYNLSSRNTIGESVGWEVLDAWQVNEKHRSPDLSLLLQNIVDRGGWVSGNAVVFLISGSGTRTAESYEGEAGAAALLHVEFRRENPGGT